MRVQIGWSHSTCTGQLQFILSTLDVLPVSNYACSDRMIMIILLIFISLQDRSFDHRCATTIR